MLRTINHTQGIVYRESVLRKKKFGKELKDCTILGVIPTNERRQSFVELLYLCTTDYTKEKSHSPYSFSASLLGNSKVIFFTHLMKICNYLDPELATPLYTGTKRFTTPLSLPLITPHL